MFDSPNHDQYRREVAPSREPLELRRIRVLTDACNGVMSLRVEDESSQPAMPIENRPKEHTAPVIDMAARRNNTSLYNTYPGQNYEGQQAA